MKYQIRRRLFGAIAICFALLCTLGGCASEAEERNTLQEAVTAVRHGVVYVQVGVEINNGDYPLFFIEESHVTVDKSRMYIDDTNNLCQAKAGSAFFVGDHDGGAQYLVTNNHVIEGYVHSGKGQLTNFFYTDDAENGDWYIGTGRSQIRVYFDDNDYVDASVVETDEVRDIALLKLASPTDKRSPLWLGEATEEMVGRAVSVVGFPGIADNEYVDSDNKKGESASSVTSGNIEALRSEHGTGVAQIQTSATIRSGNSGGPMMDERGVVVGVSTYTISGGGEEAHYAINVSEVIPILQRNGVVYKAVAANDAGPVDPGTPTPKIDKKLLIAGAAVAVIAIAAIVIALARKKPKSVQQAEEEVKPPVDTTDQITVTPPPTPRRDPDDSGYRLQCIAGALGNKRTMIPLSSHLVIGRDKASCGIRLPVNTPGVSARHCEVWVENGSVYVKDLGSTHGTFVSPGTKLAAQEPMRLDEGTEIWLGSDAERFVVARKQA